VTSIRKQLTVEAPQERAFRVFTANIGSWWPKDMHIGASPMRECVIEPQVNGRWYEVGEDGSSCEWGKVLHWEPPRRVLLAWQLNAQFTYDPAFSTEVEVTFTALGPRQTRVDFEHRQLERFGESAGPLRGQMDEGWGRILASFVGVATS
jgi:uncharacterized protein YndB with AHSA1/START domain